LNLVRGLLLIRNVKQIRAYKNGDFDKYLTEKDKKIINQTIIDEFWYDYSIFKNTFNAIDKVIAKGDVEIWKNWGRMGGKETKMNEYKLAIIPGNPKKTLEKFSRLRKLYYNFGSIKIEESSDSHLIIYFEDFDPDFKIYYYFAQGWLEKFIEQSVGSIITSKILSKSWREDPHTKILFSWSLTQKQN